MRLLLTILTLLLLVGTTAAQDRLAIDFGDTVEGLLSTGESAVEYEFTGEQGQFISITLIAASGSSIDSYLELQDADGEILMEDDDSAGSLNSRIGPYRLPANGDYVIVATSLGRDDVGAFSLTLEAVEVRRIEYGQRISGELTETEPTIEATFTAKAGDTITIDLTSDDFDAYLKLFVASPRSELITDDDSGQSYNARIGPYVLTEAGDYQIEVSSIFGDDVGAFELTLNLVKLLPISFGDSEAASISGSSTLIFAFDGEADQVVDIIVDTDNALDTALSLLGPNARSIAENDNAFDEIDPAIQRAILNESGTHFIVVEPYTSRDAATPVTITLVESELPSLDDGPQVLNLSDLDTQHLVTFTGNAGEVVTLYITLDADDHLSPDITVRQGGEQIAAITSFTINDTLSFGFDVPEDGPVLIELQDYDYVDAEITVELER